LELNSTGKWSSGRRIRHPWGLFPMERAAPSVFWPRPDLECKNVERLDQNNTKEEEV